MIQNTTPASASAYPNVKQQIFFNANSTSNTSPTFTVGTEPFYLHAFNLGSGDTVTVQQVGGSGSGTMFTSFAPLGSPVVLNQATPQVRVDWPGSYRLIFSGASVTAITVLGYEAAFGESSIYNFGLGGGGGGSGFTLIASDTNSIDLNFIGTTAGGTLTANAKISSATGNILSSTGGGLFANVSLIAGSPLQLSGSGSSGDPYDLTANIFPMPVTNLSDWPNTFITAVNLEGILYVTDTPYQMSNLGVGAGEHGANSVGETCVGYHAGVGVVGDFKVAIGHSALSGATTSASGGFAADVVVGYRAGLNAVKHTSLSTVLTALGLDAGNGITFSSATAIGRAAAANTTSTSIVAVGDSAGSGSIGDNNTFLGNLAGTGPVTTNNSVMIGAEAGEGIGAGDGIIAIGRNAGEAALQSLGPNLNGCMYIGSFAGSHDVHQDVIIIASDATTATNSTAAHQIILGKASHTELRTAGSIIAGGVISASDARLKDNVMNIVGAIEKIAQLRPVTFQWDANALNNAKLPFRPQDCGKPISGFIAQEIENIIPEVVDYTMGADGKQYMFLHYDRLIGYAFAAIQELSAKNTEFEARLAALEAKVS